MSQSFFKYETQEEICERLKRLRFKMLKDQLRKARYHMDRQKEALDDSLKKNVKGAETGFAFSDSAVSDVLTEDMGTDIDKDMTDIAEVSGLYGKFNENNDKIDGLKDGSGALSADVKRRERMNLSHYLEADKRFQDEAAARLKEILARLNERDPDSDKARAEYERLKDNIDAIMSNASYSSEQIVSMVEKRVTIYIENRNYDNSALDEDLLLDYKTLCILLGEEEQELSVEQLKSRVDNMLEEYLARNDKEVVAELINEALVNLGMKVDSCCVLDGETEGELYSSGEGGKCKVFVSCNASGVMIEPVNTDTGAAEEEILESQRSICKAEQSIVEEALKSGIVLKKVYSNEHPVEMMATEKDIQVNESAKEASDDRFERIRDYNRMKRSRRRREKAREMRNE
ncbi:MAG: hypothetical protein IJ661_06010 [Lachnospiraceae bacterium]|nr:hypothetical protein [Lachnospiraceae bacterium]